MSVSTSFQRSTYRVSQGTPVTLLIDFDGPLLCDPAPDDANWDILAGFLFPLVRAAGSARIRIIIKSILSPARLRELFGHIPNVTFIGDGGFRLEVEGEKIDIVSPPDLTAFRNALKPFKTSHPWVEVKMGDYGLMVKLPRAHALYEDAARILENHVTNELQVQRREDAVFLMFCVERSLIPALGRIYASGHQGNYVIFVSCGSANDHDMAFLKERRCLCLRLVPSPLPCTPPYAHEVLVGKDELLALFFLVARFVSSPAPFGDLVLDFSKLADMLKEGELDPVFFDGL